MKDSPRIFIIGVALCVAVVIIYALGLWIKMELPKQKPELQQTQYCNFCLRVSNQSFENKYVNIQIFIDDKLAIDDNFRVGNQHNFPKYNFTLSQGEHTLKIRSRNGNADYDGTFTLIGKRDAFITYGVKLRGSLNKQMLGVFKFELHPEGMPVIIM